MTVQDALRRMGEDDWRSYLAGLRAGNNASRLAVRSVHDEEGLAAEFVRDDPGLPLGVGMPSGSPLRRDGESHREAWARIVRLDPCSYCDRPGPGTTLDHVEPRSLPARGLGGVFSWMNFAGACERCNGKKGSRPLLDFMHRRAVARPVGY